jgi:hypothetical protein
MDPRQAWCWCWRCQVRRRRRAAAALVIVLIAAIAYVQSHPQPHSAHTNHPPAAPAPAPSRTARPTPTTAAGLIADAGQDLTWVGFHGMQLPAAAGAGPRTVRGGLAWGFADTPRGALLAAINIGVRTGAQWGTAIFGPTIIRQVTGPDTGSLLRAQDTAYAQLRAAAKVRAGQAAGQGYAAETGYRFVSWIPAAATVDVVTAGPGANGTTVLASTRIQVLWLRGDWRLVAPPDGNWANAAVAITSLTGYLLFPGQR